MFNKKTAQPDVQQAGTVAVGKAAVKPPKNNRLSLTTRRNLMGWVFILPFVIGFIMVFAPSLILSFRFGFNDIINSSTGYSLEGVGFHYYRQILVIDPDFLRGIFESTGSMFLNVFIVLIYALLIATILNRNISGKGFYRAILFLPVVISTGVIALVDGAALSGGHKAMDMVSGEVMGGLFTETDITMLLDSFNISGGFTDVIVSAANNVYKIITSSGVQLVIFLAGLQSISPAIYESATVEGCTWWESFWKITIPMISPLILVNLVYSVVDSFTSADNSVMKGVYGDIGQANFSLGSAKGFFYLLIVGVVLMVLVAIVNRFVFYENK